MMIEEQIAQKEAELKALTASHEEMVAQFNQEVARFNQRVEASRARYHNLSGQIEALRSLQSATGAPNGD